jgi:hypothetical protein
MRTIPENGMAALRLSPVAIRGDRDRKGYGLLRAIHAAADGVGCLRRTKRLWGVCCASADTRVPPITAAMVAIGRCWGFPNRNGSDHGAFLRLGRASDGRRHAGRARGGAGGRGVLSEVAARARATETRICFFFTHRLRSYAVDE